MSTTEDRPTIIPAAPGTYMLKHCLSLNDDDEKEGITWRSPVIAWRLNLRAMVPVLADLDYFRAHRSIRFAIQMPDNSLFSIGNGWDCWSGIEFASAAEFEAAANEDIEEEHTDRIARQAEKESRGHCGPLVEDLLP